MAGAQWRMRPFAVAAHLEWVEALWMAAMPPAGPLLTASIAMLGEGLVAEAGGTRWGSPPVLRSARPPGMGTGHAPEPKPRRRLKGHRGHGPDSGQR